MPAKALSIRDISFIAIFTALIAICAQIVVPLPGGVPFTLQTWAIALAGVLLGAKNGSIATLAYVLLGAVGAPVFHGFQGGFGIIMGPTGGFILSFPILALLAGFGARLQRIHWLIAGLLLGNIVNLLSGMVYFGFIMSVSLNQALYVAVMPFLPSTAMQIAFVAVIGKSMKRALARAGLMA